MQKIGAHVSSAGGVSKAPVNAHEEGCETFQFFIGSPRTYAIANITDEEVKKFKDNCKQYGFTDSYVHGSYLINLASLNEKARKNSITMLRKGLETCSRLGVKGLMFHTGSGKDHTTRESAVKKAIESLNKILDGYTGSTKLLIENAAGAGVTLGSTFTEVGQMIKGVKNKTKIGVCLDTQHAFGSGYDWTDKTAAKNAMKEFAKEIGFKKLVVVQVNDSKVECGSNRDRHEHIEKGLIGIKGMKNIFGEPALKNHSFCLETEPEGRKKDIALLKKIRTA